MNNKKEWSVYMHISPFGKRYIGITSQKPETRWNYGYGYKNNPYFWKAIQKYGWSNFKHIILLQGENFEYACAAEKCLIKHYKTKNPLYGYNMTDGGEGALGHNHTQETKQKISEKNKGRKHSEEHRKKLSEMESGEGNPMWGKHHSQETKDLISLKLQEIYSDPENHPMYGRHQSQEAKDKIGKKARERLANPENHPNYGKHINVGVNHANIRPIFCIELKRIFWGASEACQEYGFSRSGISSCLHGNQLHCGKHPETGEYLSWIYAEDAIKQGYINQQDLDNYLNNAENKQVAQI